MTVVAAVARIQELLGGEAVTGPLRTEMDVVLLVRRGLPTAAVECFLHRTRLGFPVIEAHVLPRRTFKRREAGAQALDPVESDRMVRLARLVATAEETFANCDKARIWLARPNRRLDGASPLSLGDTDGGARRVEVLLGQVAHGLAA